LPPSVRSDLFSLLVDPETKTPLAPRDGELVGGRRTYPVVSEIPRFTEIQDASQAHTARTFGYKWGRRDTYESEAMRGVARTWLLERYGFESAAALRDHLADRGVVLDVGCGSGFSTALWLDDEWASRDALWIGAEISDAIDVARDRLGHIDGTAFIQADLMRLPLRDGRAGAIFAEGVLHHTPSTRAALEAIVPLLTPGGELLFYVYRRKAPLREFTDDFVRERVAALSPEDAWRELEPFTKLGKALADLDAVVNVPDDVPLLGIKAGSYDVQRLVYWHFAKLYWNPQLSLDENTHVQFDWYHPRYAHRQSEEEVLGWCAAAGLDVERCHVEEAGITVRAVRR
jgi:SAM-dependent methyltransferase